MHVFEVLRKPLITEKSTMLQEGNKYVFEVDPGANKIQIREAVERAFDVNVKGVNITWVRGKERRVGPRRIRSSDQKKAVVTLRHGQTIQVFEGA